MNDIALEFNHVWKKFKKGEKYDSLRDLIPAMTKRLFTKNNRGELQEKEFWAVKDVSFEVKRGEVLGIIGPNGAGKSTILKLLSGILRPNKGQIKVNGRLSTLIEVGAGFHPDLTGRENVYLNGAILGMKKDEIDNKFDEIVEFSGISEFIDTPVKRYSSGMYARLGFSVAAHVDTEILVVDEVLAVGDMVFQKKCLEKMHDVAGEGRSVLFVSHNMAAIQNLCTQGILLVNGEVKLHSDISQIISSYIQSFSKHNVLDLKSRFKKQDTLPTAWFTNFEVRDLNGNRINAAISGSSIDFVLYYKTRVANPKLAFFIGIYNLMGEKLLHLGTPYSTLNNVNFQSEGEIICHFAKLPLPEGEYFINLSLHNLGQRVDHVSGALTLDVKSGDYYGTGKVPPAGENKVLVEHSWLIK